MGVHQKLFAQQKLWRLYLIALNSNIYIKFQFVCFFSLRLRMYHCTKIQTGERANNELLLSVRIRGNFQKKSIIFIVFVCVRRFFASATPWNWPFLSHTLSPLLHTSTRCSPNFLVSLHIDSFFAWSRDTWLIYINLSFYFGILFYTYGCVWWP